MKRILLMALILLGISAWVRDFRNGFAAVCYSSDEDFGDRWGFVNREGCWPSPVSGVMLSISTTIGTVRVPV